MQSRRSARRPRAALPFFGLILTWEIASPAQVDAQTQAASRQIPPSAPTPAPPPSPLAVQQTDRQSVGPRPSVAAGADGRPAGRCEADLAANVPGAVQMGYEQTADGLEADIQQRIQNGTIYVYDY